MKKKTQEEFEKEVYELVGNEYSILSKYKSAKDYVLMKHNKCGYEWNIQPSNFLSGKRCPECNKGIKLTTEKYKELIKNRIDIEVVDKYINSTTPILHKCKKCGYVFSASPNSIISKNAGCQKCNKRYRRTHEEYVYELSQINSNIIVLETFTSTNRKIKHKCLICGYEWYAIPMSLLKGSGCEKCNGTLLKTDVEYNYQLGLINSNVISIEKYIDSKTKIKHKCLKCGKIWYATPSNILSGKGCPRCNQSKGENKINKYLDLHNIKYISQYRFKNCKDKNTLPFDFYLPDYNCCIEYDGELHYQVGRYSKDKDKMINKLKSCQKHDEIKNQYCKDNAIKLIRIPYWNFNNIEIILDKERKIKYF